MVPEIPGMDNEENPCNLKDLFPKAMALPPDVMFVGAALSVTIILVISEPAATPNEPFPMNVENVALKGKL